MIIGVPRESFPGERRVALVPGVIPSLTKAGFEVVIQAGAGIEAGFPDADFTAKGARIVADRAGVFSAAEMIVQVLGYGSNDRTGRDDLPLLRSGQSIVGFQRPLGALEPIRELAERGVTAFSIELMPRTTRAQSMDALSSMGTVAGYKAVVLAAEKLPRLFPMLTTAAGTITPARVLIIGAGVAGLQAIATAKRLGAVASAYDMRPAAKEQVQSLGGRFVELPIEAKDAQDARGYGRAQDENFYQRQRELLGRVVAESDIVITAAVIPGKKSPVLVTADMVERMAPGSVIVDLAAERGGNCELTRAEEIYKVHGVTIVGLINLAGTVPYHASQMYARNVTAYLLYLVKDGKVRTDADDEIVRETLLTRDGQVVNARVLEFFAPRRRWERRHEARPGLEPVCVHAGGLHRLRGDPAGVAAVAHALDVADQRARRDRGGGGDHPGRLAARDPGDGAGHDRDRGGDEQRGGRIHDHRPDAPDVQGERTEEAIIMNDFIRGEYFIEGTYLVATALFILSLKWMSSPTTARRGVWAGEVGMLLAIVGTLLHREILDYRWIAGALVLGSIIGVRLGMVPMTAVPQRTALSHAFGSLCVTLVGAAEYYLNLPDVPPFLMSVLSMEVILGSLTFTGSLMAAGKLQEILPQRPITYKGQNLVNLGVLALAVVAAVFLVRNPSNPVLFPAIIVMSLAFGVMMIVPIGGADMPTVISLLNSYAGLSASAMGFAIDSKLLIVAGALDGASGFILSVNMSKAMNRSFTNVLFGAFGQEQVAAAGVQEARSVRSATPEEAAAILTAANKVVIVPGYGMAVAQAQHKVRELYDALTRRGTEVVFGIHPVAGRMPGHMNVLLAEADIPYDHLLEMDEINGDLPQTDVALVIGANDVTNPAAREDRNSPIYGMPILNVDKARTVMVIKRGMSPGFAGIDNPLYYLDRTLMLFGDAKSFVGSVVNEIGES